MNLEDLIIDPHFDIINYTKMLEDKIKKQEEDIKILEHNIDALVNNEDRFYNIINRIKEYVENTHNGEFIKKSKLLDKINELENGRSDKGDYR